MSQCICCGRADTEETAYACVATHTETVVRPDKRHRVRVRTETLTEIVHAAVCPACARKAKAKNVLMTIPITLALTPVLTVLSLFVAKPNRNIRNEVSSWPTVLPVVAIVVWLCGLSVYLPKPKELYAAELVRKSLGMDGDTFLLPLDRRCYRRRKDKPLRMIDITHDTAAQTELAEKLLPLIEGEADEASAQSLIGQAFTLETPAR